MNNFDRIVFVYGAGGPVGRAYVDFFARDKRNYCYGLTRGGDVPPESENCKFLKLGIDSSNQFNLLSIPGTLPLDPHSKIREIIMVYAVGPSKFEPPEAVRENPNRRGMAHNIDEDIYSLNLVCFRDLTKVLFDFIKQKAARETSIHIKLVALASIADKYDPAFWQSYTRSKTILRRYIRSVVHRQRMDPDVDIAGIVVNVSTVNTVQECGLRPFAPEEERAHWLTPQQVVDHSQDSIGSAKPGTYNETDIYNPWHGFSPDIYRDIPCSRARWLNQMFGKKLSGSTLG